VVIETWRETSAKNKPWKYKGQRGWCEAGRVKRRFLIPINPIQLGENIQRNEAWENCSLSGWLKKKACYVLGGDSVQGSMEEVAIW